MKLIKLFFLLIIIGVGFFAVRFFGIDIGDIKDRATALVLENNFLKSEVEWTTEKFDGNDKFSFDFPVGFEKKDVEGGYELSSEGEKISVIFDMGNDIATPGSASSTASSLETIQISGQKATLMKDDNGDDSVYIPVSGGGQVVVTGNGETFKETYERIDLSPEEPDWSIFGEELPETIRVAEEIDNFIDNLSPDEPSEGGEWESNIIIAVEGQPIAYIGFSDGVEDRVVAIDSSEIINDIPEVVGFYRLPIIKDGSRFIVMGKNGESVAILPTSGMVLEKKDGKWK